MKPNLHVWQTIGTALRGRLPRRRSRSFSFQLLLGLIILSILTTLSAGVPALLIIRSQLHRQTRQHLTDIQQATASLYRAQYARLQDQIELLSARPTFRSLAMAPASGEMTSYLEAFRTQSDLDVLVYCPPDSAPISLGLIVSECPDVLPSGYYQLDGRPVLLVTDQVTVDDTGAPHTLYAAIWLNESFLRQMATNTGAEQGLVSAADGRRLFSSQPAVLPRTDGAVSTAVRAMQTGVAQTSPDNHFLTTVLPLTNTDDQTILLAEISLPIEELRNTEVFASTVLIANTTLVILLGVVGGALYIRRLTAPLQRLTLAAERVSEGDFAIPLAEISGPTEVTTLAAALRQSQTTMVEALHERSQALDWLNTLIQSIVEGVITLEAGGRITFMSQGAERITQRGGREMLGQSINDLFQLPDSDRGAFADQIPPPGIKRQIEVRTTQGTPLVLAVTSAPLMPSNSETNAAQIALVLRDVTAEEALRDLRSYFLANISHEFRTPLSTLSASMELMLNEDLTADEMRRLLQPSHLSLMSLQTLIDNLLESTSIEAGSFTLRCRLIHFNQVLTEALHIVNPLLLRRHQTLSLAEPIQIPDVWADATRLTQVLVNLLGNASKYSPIGESIDLQIETTEETIRVAVADRGPGIPEGEADHIFQRFVRLDSSTGEQYGIGLGLHVVKTIIEAHSGRLGVAVRPGGGSIFWFDLSLQTPAEQ